MKASEVIVKARYTLADPNGTRWSDTRLLSLLNDAIYDIALTTMVYNASGYIELQKNVALYNISNFASKLERVEHLNVPLLKKSFVEMDDTYGSSWQTKTSSTPQAIAYDLQRSGEFVLYPIPDFGSTSLVTSNSDFGIITHLTHEEVNFDIVSDFGGIASPSYENYLKIYYTRLPKELTSTNDDFEPIIHRSMLNMLSHYITGSALRDNLDTQNRQIGNEELLLYENDKNNLVDHKMLGNVSRVRTTEYRSIE